MLLGTVQFLNNSYELERSLFLYINLLLVTLVLHHFTKVLSLVSCGLSGHVRVFELYAKVDK